MYTIILYIGATVMPDFANDSRFHCTRDADWYITSDDNKSRFIANLMIISVTQVFKNSNTPPLAFSVEYISSKNKNLLKDRQTVLVPFEKYISHSLHLAFYLPERSSSVSNHILSDLIRHCMTIALHTRMFMIPQYMGWHFNANPKYCFFAAKDRIPSSPLEEITECQLLQQHSTTSCPDD